MNCLAHTSLPLSAALTLAQIHAALAWFYDHQEEMEKEMAAREVSARALLATLGESPAQRRFRQIKAAAAL